MSERGREQPKASRQKADIASSALRQAPFRATEAGIHWLTSPLEA